MKVDNIGSQLPSIHLPSISASYFPWGNCLLGTLYNSNGGIKSGTLPSILSTRFHRICPKSRQLNSLSSDFELYPEWCKHRRKNEVLFSFGAAGPGTWWLQPGSLVNPKFPWLPHNPSTKFFFCRHYWTTVKPYRIAKYSCQLCKRQAS